MSASSSSSRRREMDVVKLMKSSRQFYPSDCISEFWVVFNGPEGTPYEEGTWVLHVLLPPEYPMKSPSIGFSNRILHPNVDEASGSVCLDVINQTWTPMYELKNIFDVFLPQLLRYPNPSDPLNATAAAYLQRDPTGYVTRVQEHVAVYATPEKALSCIPPPYGPQPLSAEDGNPCEEDANRNNNGCSDASACGDTTTNHNMLSDSSVTPTEKGIGASDAVGGVEEYVPEEIEI